jgi:redox-sensitive bicupin YhaK (pirin superfamily)
VEQRQFTRDQRHNRLLRVVGPEGGEVVKVHQDATVHVGSLDPEIEVGHGFREGRAGYLYVIAGRAGLNAEHALATGDAVKIIGPERLGLRAIEATELILVDVPETYTPVGAWAR